MNVLCKFDDNWVKTLEVMGVNVSRLISYGNYIDLKKWQSVFWHFLTFHFEFLKNEKNLPRLLLDKRAVQI